MSSYQERLTYETSHLLVMLLRTIGHQLEVQGDSKVISDIKEINKLLGTKPSGLSSEQLEENYRSLFMVVRNVLSEELK